MAELLDPDLTEPDLEWRDGAPVSRAFDDVYFSSDGGDAETRHVFLRGNDLPERWRGRDRFVIGETGFGTGLNFLEAWRAWRGDAERCRHFHFVSVEGFPLGRESLAAGLRAYADRELADELVAQYPARAPGFHRVEFEEGRVVLTLLLGEVQTQLARIANGEERTVDAWFLDGFAPGRNPGMWSPEVFREMARLSRDGATFATYTSAGFVRRGLEEVGFAVEKRPGFGNKREMAVGRWERSPVVDRIARPWQRWPRAERERDVLVIGGGLAGTAIARSLSARGRDVTLVERAASLASEGSGNPAGIYHADLMLECTRRERLFTGAVGFTARRLASYRDRVAGEACGAIHPSTPEKRASRHAEIRERRRPHPEVACWFSPEEASDVAGLRVDQPALFYPQAGWVSPADVCRANIDIAPSVTVHTETEILALDRVGDEWIATTASGRHLSAPIVVIASSGEASQLPIVSWLPLRKLRGQITCLPETDRSSLLRSVVYYEGYATPSHAGKHTIGATFDPHSTDSTVREGDHRTNLERLQRGFPALHTSLASKLDQRSGRAALRSVTPDHLPLVGPVPDEPAFRRQFDGLRFGRPLDEQTIAPFLPGLYVSVGHGSRGIVSTQFGAELLASQIVGDPLPTEHAIVAALTPSRFLVRDLSRRIDE